MSGVELGARDLVLPAHDLVEALGLHERDGRRELAHAEVQARDLVGRLAVVAEQLRVLDQVVVAGDEHAALAGRDRLRRVERVDAGVAVGAGLARRSSSRRGRGRSPRSGRCPRRGRARRSARESKAMWPPMCTRIAAFGLCSATLRSKSSNDMQRSSRLQSTNSTLRAGVEGGERRGHEGVGGHEHGLALARRRTRAPRARRRTSRRTPPPAARCGRPRPASNAGGEVALGPAAGVDHAVPELVQARAVALVESDRELGEVGRACDDLGPGSALGPAEEARPAGFCPGVAKAGQTLATRTGRFGLLAPAANAQPPAVRCVSGSELAGATRRPRENCAGPTPRGRAVGGEKGAQDGPLLRSGAGVGCRVVRYLVTGGSGYIGSRLVETARGAPRH